MTTRYRTIAMLAALLTAAAAPAPAQSGADLLQKGIYAQETLGDLDGAIQIYRQVTASPATQPLAAQAQYQLVLCMLQKGDRAAATHELDLLTRNFPNQQDFINKARKLIPGASTMLAPPWADGEASQLNIKRDGVFTGEYLYYTATPWRATMNLENYNPSDRLITENAQAMYLGWELVTKSSTRSVLEKVDRDSLRAMENATLQTDDLTGDSSAAAFAGPAIDAEALVFHMRLLPLAVGYKTTLTTLPFLLGYGTPKPAELVVSGVEPVQTVAGKFNCYKLSFASLGQTFWIGVDGARPLVKFQSAKVEAELVKVWGPTVFNDALSFLKTAGWLPKNLTTDRGGPTGYAFAASPANSPFQQLGVHVEMRRIYTPAAEIEPALQRACPDRAKELSSDSQERSVRPGSIRTVRFGSYPAVSCVIDLPSPSKSGEFDLWVASNSLILRFHRDVDRDLPVFLWMFEPVLNGIKLP